MSRCRVATCHHRASSQAFDLEVRPATQAPEPGGPATPPRSATDYHPRQSNLLARLPSLVGASLLVWRGSLHEPAYTVMTRVEAHRFIRPPLGREARRMQDLAGYAASALVLL